MLSALRTIGVDVEYVYELGDARTSLSSILVKDNVPGFIGAPEASRKITENQIRRALRGLRSDDIVLVDFEVPQPLTSLPLEIGRAAGATTVLNPAPFFTDDCFDIDYLHLVDVLIPNRLEAQLLAAEPIDDDRELARRLLRYGIRQVVMTLGELGSIYVDAHCEIEQPVFAVDAVGHDRRQRCIRRRIQPRPAQALGCSANNGVCHRDSRPGLQQTRDHDIYAGIVGCRSFVGGATGLIAGASPRNRQRYSGF